MAIPAASQVRVIETPLIGLEGEGDQLHTLYFADGSTLARYALFLNLKTSQHSDLYCGWIEN